MPGNGQLLFGRQAKLTLQIPVTTAGNFKDVSLADQIAINGGQQDAQNFGLRIVFKISKTSEKEPNNNEVTVYNLAPTTRGRLQIKGIKVLLEAGYLDTGVQRIFLGDSRTTDHVREGADWKTVLKVADGERSFRFARANLSFAPGTSKSTVLQAVAAAGGLGLGNVEKQANDLQGAFNQGFTGSGQWSAVMHKLVRQLGLNWSIQDGEIQVLKPYESLPLQGIPDITPQTGLVGSPEMGTPEKKGKPTLVKFKTLLTYVKPGSRVNLRSERYDGPVVCKKVTFTGDTHSNEWYTEIEGVLQKGSAL